MKSVIDTLLDFYAQTKDPVHAKTLADLMLAHRPKRMSNKIAGDAYKMQNALEWLQSQTEPVSKTELTKRITGTASARSQVMKLMVDELKYVVISKQGKFELCSISEAGKKFLLTSS